MKNKEIKGIIFDMDGVLIDSESISDITWSLAAKDFNYPVSMEILNECRGTNKQDTYQIMKKHFGDEFPTEAFFKKTSEYFWKIDEEQGIPLMPFVKECLEYLSGKYELALASSTRQVSVEKLLTKNEIIDYFPRRMCGDMVTHSKPHPEIYQKACQLLGLKPEECAAVEDSPNGIKSAVAAGLKVIMVPDRIKPTEEIIPLCWKISNSLAELKTYL